MENRFKQNFKPRCLILGALLITLAGGCADFAPRQPENVLRSNGEDFATKQPANVILNDAHQGGTVVAFNTNSTLLASGGNEGQILLSSVPGGSPITRVKAHRGRVSGIGFLEATQLVSIGYDKRLVMWDISGIMLREIRASSPITRMSMSRADQVMVTGHKDGTIRIWKLPGLELKHEYSLHRGKVLSVAWDTVNQRLASSGSDGRVFVWTADKAPAELVKAPGKSASLLFSPDGRKLFGGGWFKLYLWDMENGALRVFPTEHHGLIYRLGYTGDDKTLATISRQTDSAVYFLNAQNGAVVRRFQSHNLCGADIAVSPDGRYLATTSDDSSVRLWDLHSPALTP